MVNRNFFVLFRHGFLELIACRNLAQHLAQRGFVPALFALAFHARRHIRRFTTQSHFVGSTTRLNLVNAVHPHRHHRLAHIAQCDAQRRTRERNRNRKITVIQHQLKTIRNDARLVGNLQRDQALIDQCANICAIHHHRNQHLTTVDALHRQRTTQLSRHQTIQRTHYQPHNRMEDALTTPSE